MFFMIGFTPYGESNINYVGMANCSLQFNDFTDMPGNGSERPTTHAQTCIINEAHTKKGQESNLYIPCEHATINNISVAGSF